jgi:hypothetical protein
VSNCGEGFRLETWIQISEICAFNKSIVGLKFYELKILDCLIMQFQLFFKLSLVLSIVNCTFDLNVHQIQFIADSLSNDECRNLLILLDKGMKDHMAELGITMRSRNETISNESTKLFTNCFLELIDWNSRDGVRNTFHYLKDKLDAIKRQDLGTLLSKSIYHENALDVKRVLKEELNIDLNVGSSSNQRGQNLIDELDENKFFEYNRILSSHIFESFKDKVLNKKVLYIAMIIIFGICIGIVGFIARSLFTRKYLKLKEREEAF